MKTFIWIFLFLVFLYLAFSIDQLTFNVFDWGEKAKRIYSVLSGVTLLIGLFTTEEIMKKEN